MTKSDPYYGRTYTPAANTENKQPIENSYNNYNVKNDYKEVALGGRSKTLGLVGLNNIGNTCFM